MTWNYRVVKRVHEDSITYGIYEVFYDNGKISGISAEPVPVIIEPDPDEIGKKIVADELDRMSLALSKPTLDYEDIAGEK